MPAPALSKHEKQSGIRVVTIVLSNEEPHSAISGVATIGKGKFKIASDRSEVEGIDQLSFAIVYEQQAEQQHSADLFYRAENIGGFGHSVDYHSEQAQIGPEATAAKHVSFSQIFHVALQDGDTMDIPIKYLGQFREGHDFWSGSVLDENSGIWAGGSFTDICAQISTGDGVDESNCADVGGIDIRVGDTPFVRDAEPSDTAITDFPAAPTVPASNP